MYIEIDSVFLIDFRLYKKLLSKQGKNITSKRLFMTPNPDWKKNGVWFKNTPVGRNEMSKWTKMSAEISGLDNSPTIHIELQQ